MSSFPPPSALGPRVCTETGLPQGPGGASAAKGGALASLALARRAPGWRWPSAARPAQAPDCAGPARHSQSRFARRVCPLAGEGRPAPASSRRGSGRTLGALAPRPASGADTPCDLLESHFLPRPLSRHENLEEAVWGPSVGSWVQGRDANRKRQALDSAVPALSALRMRLATRVETSVTSRAPVTWRPTCPGAEFTPTDTINGRL